MSPMTATDNDQNDIDMDPIIPSKSRSMSTPVSKRPIGSQIDLTNDDNDEFKEPSSMGIDDSTDSSQHSRMSK